MNSSASAPRPLRARYIGYTRDTQNHGDEAMIWILRDLLAPEILVDPECDPFDIALLGGGTLINQSPWLIDVFNDALQQAGRGMVLGTGVGDTAFWGNHFERWIPLLNKCDFVGVRGPDSLALLRENGCAKAQCIGDPYLLLDNPLPRDPVPRRLGINLGCTNNSLWGTNDADFHSHLLDVARRLREDGWEFAWFSVWSKDLPLVETARQRVGAPLGPLYDARSRGLESLAALSGCEVFLGEKLHACAMAAVTGVPFIALEYQPKLRDFAASLDMTDWVVSTADRDVGALAARVESLRIHREPVRHRMVEARDALRRRFRRFVRDVKSFYVKGHAPCA